ncbi:MAG: hypothetical protein HOM55_01255 [Proteobacteria bacterium]|jgi:hypothetical protein|nr:hypothetical protein [Pseudomonadota bacterium]
MIADPESEVIESFGLRNPNPEPGSRVDGMAFPGTYIVDENGVVQEKFFNMSHRQRLTVDSVLMSSYGAGEAGGQRVEADIQPQFKMTAFLSEEEAQPGNQFLLVAEFDLYDKVHLYAEGSDYRAVDLVLNDNPMLQEGELKLPEPEIMYLEVIDESVPVYHGKVRVSRIMTLSPNIEGETLEISANLEYQTCDDEYCFEPSSLPLTFSLSISEHDRQRAPEGVRHPE